MPPHTPDSLLAALRTLVEQRGPNITLFDFRQETGIPYYYIYDRWGSWTKLRRAAGLPARVELANVYSDDELLAAYHRVAAQLNAFPGIVEFNRLAGHSWNSLAARFGKHPEIQQAYRHWLAQHPEETTPEFLLRGPEPEPTNPSGDCNPRLLPPAFDWDALMLQQVMGWQRPTRPQ